jgi:hypothetical protein
VRGVILVSLENANFHMVHVYTINWFKKVQNINYWRVRTDEQRYAIISPYFDGRIKMNGPYPEITNISFLVKLFFKTFISLKHLSDYWTVGLSDRRTIGLIGKVIEKIHLTRNSNSITEQQNKLQKGFTQGEMPIIAALILLVANL